MAASADVAKSVMSNPYVGFQDIDYELASGSSTRDLVLNGMEYYSDTTIVGGDELGPKLFQSLDSHTYDPTDTVAATRAVSFTSPLGTVVNVLPEC